ncbi:basic proline-rich protein-like [Mustela erminea]|uniref:basic proline-rich protein-like n=1 Tax=Mustela erminea TaxID=36723 RepID=UPI001386771F|nr:basic proline-rich protein-like [Mustela erminea]
MNGAGLNGRPRRRRRRKEFAARCERGRGWRLPARPSEHRGKDRRASLPRGAVVGRRQGRLCPAGRAMAVGEGEVTRYITRQLPRSGTPRAAQAARGRPAVPGPAHPPQPRLRPSALGPQPGRSAAPPGDACPVPPLPHPAAGPGVAHLPRCPGPPCPGTTACSASRAPAPLLPPHSALARGPKEGRGKESHCRAAAHARPTLTAAGPARVKRRLPPLPFSGGRAPRSSAPPLPLHGRRAPWLLLLPLPACVDLPRAHAWRAPVPAPTRTHPPRGVRAGSAPCPGRPPHRGRGASELRWCQPRPAPPRPPATACRGQRLRGT